MKAINRKEVRRYAIRFGGYLAASVLLAIIIFSSFLKTSSIEINALLKEADKQESIRLTQIKFTESLDSIHYYMKLLNSGEQINYPAVSNLINQRRLELINEMQKNYNANGNQEYNLLYRNLLTEIDTFFLVKNSIRISELELEDLKERYARCVKRNNDLSLRLYTGEIY